MKNVFILLFIFLSSGVLVNSVFNLYINPLIPIILILTSFLFRKKIGLILLLIGIFLYGMATSYKERIEVKNPYVFVDCLVVNIPKEFKSYLNFRCYVLDSDLNSLLRKKINVISKNKQIYFLSEVGFIGRVKQENGSITVYPVKDFLKVSQSPFQFFKNLRDSLIENYRRNSLSRETFSLGKALIFGDKSEISYRTKKSFIETGLAHLLAISGLHIGILIAVIVFIVRNQNIRNRLIITILPLYAVFTGLHIPVVRASLMGVLYFFGRVRELRVNPLNILFFVAFAVVLISPESIFSIGFQLSFIATLGILLSLEIISVRIFDVRLLNIITQLFILSFIATVFTLPVILYHFGAFSPITVLATPVTIVPLYAFIGLSVFALLSGFFIEPLIKIMDYFGLLFLKTVEFFHTESGYIKGFSPGLIETVVIIMFLILIFSLRMNIFYKIPAALISIVVFLTVSKTGTDTYRIYVFKGKYRPSFVVSEPYKTMIIVSDWVSRDILKVINKDAPENIYVLTKRPENFMNIDYDVFPIDNCIKEICIYKNGKILTVKIKDREIKIKNKTYTYELEKK